MATLLGAAFVIGAIDPASATIIVAALSFAAAVVVALINANATRRQYEAEELIRRAKRRMRELEKAAGAAHEDEDEW